MKPGKSDPNGLPRRVAGAGARTPDVTRGRCRSFCFLERTAEGRLAAGADLLSAPEGERWTVFLVTYPGDDGHWRGHFLFRSSTADPGDEEIRTATLFVEASEAEVDQRARSLGLPLLSALLESALHTHERKSGFSSDVRHWFRDLLARHSAELIADVGFPTSSASLSHLRSLYDSYRLDQVAHLISLVEPQAFDALVGRVLEGREIDFRARDRFQLAMIVVQELERRLPLPPFETWVEDYLARPDEYQRYSYVLHREGELP